jgi:hypothetical protein
MNRCDVVVVGGGAAGVSAAVVRGVARLAGIDHEHRASGGDEQVHPSIGRGRKVTRVGVIRPSSTWLQLMIAMGSDPRLPDVPSGSSTRSTGRRLADEDQVCRAVRGRIPNSVSTVRRGQSVGDRGRFLAVGHIEFAQDV